MSRNDPKVGPMKEYFMLTPQPARLCRKSISADSLPRALPNPRIVSDNETIDAVQSGNNGRSMPMMADVDAASAAP